jgi:signal transduction histidine kinase
VGVASHLREVFLSLGLNALEAMPNGGQLTIRVRIETELANCYTQMVVIAFTDTGSGIPDERLQEIFEPFYTTKNGNAGLGLAICYSIIEHHAGYLSVRTSEQGTTFEVNLPAISSSDTP